jgi:hypothetical protein
MTAASVRNSGTCNCKKKFIAISTNALTIDPSKPKLFLNKKIGMKIGNTNTNKK